MLRNFNWSIWRMHVTSSTIWLQKVIPNNRIDKKIDSKSKQWIMNIIKVTNVSFRITKPKRSMVETYLNYKMHDGLRRLRTKDHLQPGNICSRWKFYFFLFISINGCFTITLPIASLFLEVDISVCILWAVHCRTFRSHDSSSHSFSSSIIIGKNLHFVFRIMYSK